MARIAYLLVAEDDKEILGVRFAEFNGGKKTFVDLDADDIPVDALDSLVAFPIRLLYPNGDYLSTEDEIRTGVLINSAEGEKKAEILRMFEDPMFKVSKFSEITEVLELAYQKGIKLRHIKNIALALTKSLSKERINDILTEAVDSKTLRFVFASIIETQSGQLNAPKGAVTRFIRSKQHDEAELVSLKSLNLVLDKGFDSLTYSYNIPESIKTHENIEEALNSFIDSFGDNSQPVVCTGRSEFTTPFGITVQGKVLMASNSPVFAKMVGGDIVVPDVHTSKLLTKVSNYETKPAVLEGDRTPIFKEVILQPKKAVSLWVYASEKEMTKIIQSIGNRLGVHVKVLSI